MYIYLKTSKLVLLYFIIESSDFITGQRRDRSLPRPTWLPDGRSWVNSSSMSELGIVCMEIFANQENDLVFLK
jgi:hypothetical protein